MGKHLPFKDLWIEGTIVHFKKFDFEDGLEKKGRFAIVLQSPVNGKCVFATVSASFIVHEKAHKHNIENQGGSDCINHTYTHCFRFNKDIVICSKGFKFPKTCYMDLGEVKNMIIDSKTDKYLIDTYHKKGKLHWEGQLMEKNFIELIECIIKSEGITGHLNSHLENLLVNLKRKQDDIQKIATAAMQTISEVNEVALSSSVKVPKKNISIKEIKKRFKSKSI